MLEAIVNGSGINETDESELANVPQPLNPRMIQYLSFIFGDEDRAVDGITDFVGLGHSADFFQEMVINMMITMVIGVGLVPGTTESAMGIYKPIDRY